MKTLICLLALVSPVCATTILIDFGPNATTGTPATWNNFSPSTTGASSTSLVDSTNTATSYTFAINGSITSPIIGDNNTDVARVNATASPFNITTVMSDAIYHNAQRTLTLSGLDPSVAYTIRFYSYVTRTDSRQTQFTINSASQVVEPASGTSGGVVTFSNIMPNSSGIINADVVRAANNIGNNWILSAVEITYTIPEPSAAMLSALGIIPLLRRRR